jgi:cholesterol transport system auxiliary component
MKRMRVALACTGLLAACTGLQPQPVEPQNIFLLEAGAVATVPRPKTDQIIEVEMPRSRVGFDTAQIAYTRRSSEIEYFSRNRWADTPARMLAPALAQAIEQTGAFRAVVRDGSAVHPDVRLETELIRLQQDFGVRPSRVEIAVRVLLAGSGAAGKLATAQFEESEDASSDDPYGGVMAANRALTRLVGRVAEFCALQLSQP